MGNHLRMIVNAVDVVEVDAPLPKLPVARALWVPRPDLKRAAAAAAWIYACGAYHTSFSLALNVEHLEDFAEIAGMEFLRIDRDTQIRTFKNELRWNDSYYRLSSGL